MQIRNAKKKRKKGNDAYKATKMMRDLLKVASSLGMEKLSIHGRGIIFPKTKV
jgi:hypothetical protein